jgi:putative phosphoesterase
MRTLVVSDIHGNLAALEAVLAEPHDAVICLGDLVGYGPEPAACIRLVREAAHVVIQGNHDRANADGVAPRCRPAFEWLADAVVPLTRSQLAPGDVAYLSGLPRWAETTVGDLDVLCVHATPADPLYRYVGGDPVAWARETTGVNARLLLVGHTHLQFDLEAGRTRVVNPGSVGQPKDGDPRAAYALIDGETVTLMRVAYPVERTVERLQRAGIAEDAVADLSILLRTGVTPPARPPAP